MKKWTVRVDDDVAEAFIAFCDVNGVSIQSTLVQMISAVVNFHNENGGLPVHEWADETYQAALSQRWTLMISNARALDTERRRRS